MDYKIGATILPPGEQLSSDFKPGTEKLYVRDPMPNELFQLQNFIQNVKETDSNISWSEMYKKIHYEGCLRLLQKDEIQELIFVAVNGLGKSATRDIQSMQCVERILNTIHFEIDPELAIQIIENSLHALSTNKQRKYFYLHCGVMMTLCPHFREYDEAIALVVFDSIFMLLFERSTDPLLEVSFPIKALTEIFTYNPLPIQKLQQACKYFTGKLSSNDQRVQETAVQAIKQLIVTVPELTSLAISNTLFDYTMKMDPATTPLIGKALCDLYTSINFEYYDLSQMKVDIVGRMKSFWTLDMTRFEIPMIAALRCFRTLCKYSPYIRKRILEENVIEKINLVYASFKIKAELVSLIANMIRSGPWLDEIIPNEDIIGLIFEMVDYYNIETTYDALFLALCLFEHGIDISPISEEISDLANSDDERVADLAIHILNTIDPPS